MPKRLALAAGSPDDRAPVYEHLPHESMEATFNDAALTAGLAAAIGRELGKGNVVEIETAMVSEDFGRFGDGGKIPTVMLALGAREAGALAQGRSPGCIRAGFAPASPELVLRTGMRAAVSAVLDLLKR